jgi:hypothetical protein
MTHRGIVVIGCCTCRLEAPFRGGFEGLLIFPASVATSNAREGRAHRLSPILVTAKLSKEEYHDCNWCNRFR